MRLTAKGNHSWLALTAHIDSKKIFIRTRDIQAVEEGEYCTAVFFSDTCAQVKEKHTDILKALDVNIPMEVPTDNNQDG